MALPPIEYEGDTEVAASVVPTHEINQQIATAKKYPRVITEFRRRVSDLINSDKKIAEGCYYLLPRAGTKIPGPSVRLAEICASYYWNLRVDSQVLPIEDGDRFVRGRAMCWDLESNVAIAFQSIRRATDNNGRIYSEDMLVTTGNAAVSIAIRNAIFKVIPSPFWRPFYDQAVSIVRGDIRTLPERRSLMLKDLAQQGVSPDYVCAAVDVASPDEITGDHIVIINGIMQAVVNGDISIDDAFKLKREAMPKRSMPTEKAPEQKAADDALRQQLKTETGTATGEAKSPEPKKDFSQVSPASSPDDRLGWIRWLALESTDEEFKVVDEARFTSMTSGLKGGTFVALVVQRNKRKDQLKANA